MSGDDKNNEDRGPSKMLLTVSGSEFYVQYTVIKSLLKKISGKNISCEYSKEPSR